MIFSFGVFRSTNMLPIEKKIPYLFFLYKYYIMILDFKYKINYIPDFILVINLIFKK